MAIHGQLTKLGRHKADIFSPDSFLVELSEIFKLTHFLIFLTVPMVRCKVSLRANPGDVSGPGGCLWARCAGVSRARRGTGPSPGLGSRAWRTSTQSSYLR